MHGSQANVSHLIKAPLDNVVTVGGAVEAAAGVEAVAPRAPTPPPAYEDAVRDNYELVQEILDEAGPVQVLIITSSYSVMRRRICNPPNLYKLD